ncbi:MAG: hypothetical protein JRD93_13285 [Deltaproteobacteria bacterium]|nr:hypothetical protein [Deltaproteobacteria bacterium]MBW2662929.1 hypothetical protein [Deltaproteobacteria bacterium]
MTKKRGKSVSFDAMVKFFMRQYDIPTKKDVNSLIARLERLEKLIKTTAGSGKSRRVLTKTAKGKTSVGTGAETASDIVLKIIKNFKNGVDFPTILAKTGFGEKKVRNIIFRLDQSNRIKRKNRGIYIAS